MEKIVFLGTGAGSSIKFYNSCFALQKDNEFMLIDGGGGINILEQLKKANIPLESIKNIFVTHNHIDHITGVIWLIRMFGQIKNFNEEINIYASNVTINAVKTLCKLLLSKIHLEFVNNYIHFNVVADREEVTILNEKFTFYDVKAAKEVQFGFRIDMNNNKILVCNGDETLNEANYDLVKNADYLIHEAFCLDSEKEIKQPYKIGHATSKDVCEIASKLNVKNLILYHISSSDVENRKIKYLSENKNYFTGNLYVPNDLEEIEI